MCLRSLSFNVFNAFGFRQNFACKGFSETLDKLLQERRHSMKILEGLRSARPAELKQLGIEAYLIKMVKNPVCLIASSVRPAAERRPKKPRTA
jgi:hypothetical protein